MSSFELSDRFVTQLINHHIFRQEINKLIAPTTSAIPNTDTLIFSSVIQEVSNMMYEAVRTATQKQNDCLVDYFREMSREFEKIKQYYPLHNLKHQINCKQLEMSTFQEEDQIPALKKTITELQDKMREISLSSSFQLQSAQFLKDKPFDEVFQERISQEISGSVIRLERELLEKQANFENVSEKRLQKMMKTINNVLETLNDQGQKQEKLSNSKSGTRLKSFFGLVN